MNRFQSWLFCILQMGMAGSSAAAEEVWSLDGFKTPESVLYDAKRNVLYVTNIAGEAAEKDGVGYLSQVSPDGKLKTAEWVKGFDAPKGLVMKGDTLFVTDIDRPQGSRRREWSDNGNMGRGGRSVPQRHRCRRGRPCLCIRYADEQDLCPGERCSLRLARERRPSAPKWHARRRWPPSCRRLGP